MVGQKGTIRTARWDIYPHCNLNCIHCCAEGLFNYLNSDYLEAESAINLLDKLWRDGITHLNMLGKEPFLHPHIDTILQYACKRGFQVDITTNGTTIKDIDTSLLVNLGLRSIYFSIDGSSPQVNDVIRGEGVFQKALDTMQTLLKEKEREKSSLMVNVNTVLTKMNASDINNIVDLCIANGVSLFKLSHLLDLGNASHNKMSLYLEPREEFQVAEEVMKNIPRHTELAFDILSDRPMFLEYFYKKYEAVLPVRMSGCKACSKEIYIDPIGGISPCLASSAGFSDFSSGYYEHYTTSIFDLKDKPIYELPFFEGFKSAFSLTKDTYSSYVPCNSCPYLTTICYPCPLDSSKGGHLEELCLIAEEELDKLTPEER